MNSGGAGGAVGILFVFFLLAYFIPTVIAVLRKHKDAPAIAAINILLGWSVVGWFVSFIWSLSDPKGRGGAQTVVINTAQHNVTAAPPHYPPAAPEPARRTVAVSAGATADDHDTAFWDNMRDKNDLDELEEYLIRFPAGRFAQLARNKLERGGVRAASVTEISANPPAAVEPPPAPISAKTSVCADCDAPLEPDCRFCADCGTAVAT
jgi:hypothetical protein